MSGGFGALARLAGRLLNGSAELLTAEEKLAVQEGRLTLRQAQGINQQRNLLFQIGTTAMTAALTQANLFPYGITHEGVAALQNVFEAIGHVESAMNQIPELSDAAHSLHQLGLQITQVLKSGKVEDAKDLVKSLNQWLVDYGENAGLRIAAKFGFDTEQTTWWKSFRIDVQELIGISMGVSKPSG